MTRVFHQQIVHMPSKTRPPFRRPLHQETMPKTSESRNHSVSLFHVVDDMLGCNPAKRGRWKHIGIVVTQSLIGNLSGGIKSGDYVPFCINNLGKLVDLYSSGCCMYGRNYGRPIVRGLVEFATESLGSKSGSFPLATYCL